jgi:hypothetical protein
MGTVKVVTFDRFTPGVQRAPPPRLWEKLVPLTDLPRAILENPHLPNRVKREVRVGNGMFIGSIGLLVIDPYHRGDGGDQGKIKIVKNGGALVIININHKIVERVGDAVVMEMANAKGTAVNVDIEYQSGLQTALFEMKDGGKEFYFRVTSEPGRLPRAFKIKLIDAVERGYRIDMAFDQRECLSCLVWTDEVVNQKVGG